MVGYAMPAHEFTSGARDLDRQLMGPGGGPAGSSSPVVEQLTDLKEEKIQLDTSGAAAKANANAEETDEEGKQDRAAQSLLNKLISSNIADNAKQEAVLRWDPNSSVYSVKSFEELLLKPQLLQGVYAMCFNHPSQIQDNALL